MLSSHQTRALRRAAVHATLAPSVHNTQPWRLRVRVGELAIYADRSRQLHVLDPTGRQLMISCGCALFNARASLAADGVAVAVRRHPEQTASDHLASLDVGSDSAEVEADIAALDGLIEARQTNRRRFHDESVPEQVLQSLEAAAAAEGASLAVVRHPDQRVAVAALSQHADQIENLNPAYRAELRAWTTDDPARRDGVPAHAVPHVDAGAQDEVPIRDFDTRGTGGLPTETRSSRNQCLVLVCTTGDAPADWLRAGEALERVLLEITRQGYVASPLTQITEVPSARAHLRTELALMTYPHVLLRIGRAAATPASRRRRLMDVLVDET
ncbi:MAG TPA: GNAT family N-acetyltransferase [Jatrophihabitans sp.]|nr:GNAT family N-acetyltransferase [Jatrophihabitans sp.]